MNCQKNVNSIPTTQPPHKPSHTAATPGHNNFESPNTLILIKIYPVTTIVLNK
jgi:hypothetical protein